MKKTTPLKVFISIYIGLFLGGILALVIDVIERFGFGWLYHIYYLHGWLNNFTGWFRFVMSYGLVGFPIVLIFSYFSSWFINLFVRDSANSSPIENSQSSFARLTARLLQVLLVLFFSYSLMSIYLWQLDLHKQRALLLERRTQQQKVMERVQLAGGWSAVRRGCVNLAEQNTNGFYSHFYDTNSLPAAIIALNPMMVEYYPEYGCVRIRIFGIHSTGGHSTPYYGLEVDTTTNSIGYNHGTGYDNGGIIGNRHSTNNQVAEGIYEIY